MRSSIVQGKKLISKNIIVCVFLIFAMIFTVSCGGNGTGADAGANAPTDHLSLGERFLLELEYEQALFHFLALIEIEPMNPRGYTGAAQAHVGLGQTDEAIAILQLGLEVLPDNADILNMLNELQGYIADEDKISMQPWYLLTDEQRDMLTRLEVAVENFDYRTTYNIMSSSVFRELFYQVFYQVDPVENHPNYFHLVIRFGNENYMALGQNRPCTCCASTLLDFQWYGREYRMSFYVPRGQNNFAWNLTIQHGLGDESRGVQYGEHGAFEW